MFSRIIVAVKTAVYKFIHRALGTLVLPVFDSPLNKLRGILQGIRGGDRFQRYTTVKMSHHMFRSPYVAGEKIRIVFLFQAASFWPSWETVWQACQDDDQIEPIMLVCDDPIKEKIQFVTARQFLKDKGIAFQHISEVNLDEVRPHIVVLHTPYDSHRPKYLYAPRLSANGYRIVYIPYGIEISDSDKARSDHFENNVTTNAWRVYTFSKEIIPDYKIYSPTGGDMIRSFGHPRFDGLVNMQSKRMPETISAQANGRKIVLWKVHFPKEVQGNMITPEISEYFNFAKEAGNYKDLFFIFMPHPKFYEQLSSFADVEGFQSIIESTENIFEFNDDEYQQVLVNCDYYMIDRSALMVEAGITGKPILYLQNDSYIEPMTAPVQRIIDSYYQASTCDGMKSFLDDVVLQENDPEKLERLDIYHYTLPDLDGLNGVRIKNDMVASLKADSR